MPVANSPTDLRTAQASGLTSVAFGGLLGIAQHHQQKLREFVNRLKIGRSARRDVFHSSSELLV